MANKMLIDAAHPEETRVVVLRGSRVEEFDFESANKKQLRGNIYLAKVTRVEPSLQAAFVDYGGNRHGFLAFSEIHPDYYQIPFSDRQALLDAEMHDEQEEEEERKPKRSRRRRGGDRNAAAAHRPGDESVSEHASPEENHDGAAEQAGQTDFATQTAEHQGLDPDEAPHESTRPIERDASETPPYDDPTAGLIEHASIVHSAAESVVEDAETSADGATEPVGATRQPGELAHESHASEQPIATAAPAAITPATIAPAEDSDAEIDIGSSETSDARDLRESALDRSSGDHPNERSDMAPASREDRAADHDDDEDEHDEEEHVEQLGGDAMEEIPVRVHRSRRQYKIQEVIKRRQILLVQVVKEERGNKGAAITTYLSLAGRYSVLMPNTARGGGISRKITDAGDRQRLKSIAQELEVPDGMGVILRTAGAARTKPEVKRDFEYLMRMWETVRETTLSSSAPTLVYEEGSLIKRAIRDLYNKDVEEVVVAGEEGYREAKEFMRLLMPSHTKNVQPWRDPAPIFTKAGAEAQLDAMFSSQVTLKSGGYIVINQTEALVAIDVNSGRSTREHNIEDTALRTNLEASDEVARQLRLRDLAGLIVIDFIDMEESRNNRAIERRMKEALKNDRARIQIGRISHFGLLEMSRQRIRTGVLEGSTVMCEHCAGAGMVRSTSSIALHVLRVLEDALIQDASRNVIVRARGSVALYILNQKRAHLADLEARFGATVTVDADEHLTGMTYCAVERGDFATGIIQPAKLIPAISEPEIEEVQEEDDGGEEIGAARESLAAQESAGSDAGAEAQDENGDIRRKRRRRRGRGRDRESSGITEDAPQPADDALSFVADMEGALPSPVVEEVEQPKVLDGEGEEEASRVEGRDGKRRRSRRGGRRARGDRPRIEGEVLSEEAQAQVASAVDATMAELPGIDQTPHAALRDAPSEAKADAPATDESRADRALDAAMVPGTEITPASEPIAEPKLSESPPEAPTASDSTEASASEAQSEPAQAQKPAPVSSELDPAAPKRSGWWQRAKASLGS